MLQDIAVSSGDSNPYEFITKYLECNRVPLFEIITQYRSIFMDDSEEISSDSTKQSVSMGGDRGLLFFWIHQRVAAILDIVDKILPRLREVVYPNDASRHDL